MANFFKRDGSDKRGYDASLNKQYIEASRTSDVALWGGADSGEKLLVALNDPSIGGVTETPPDPPDLRYFVVRGDRVGSAMLEAKNSQGAVWAFMQVEVVEALPAVAPPTNAAPGGCKNTVNGAGDAPTMVTSDAGRQWIKNSEGLRLDYYDIDSEEARKDPSKGNCTVAWGHLVHRGPCDPAKGEAGTISMEQAERYFTDDVAGKERFVNSKKLALTQTEFDALVDLAFQSWKKAVEAPLRCGDKATAAEILGDGGERPARRKILFLEGRYVDRGQK